MDKRVIANLMEERRWVEVTNNSRRTTENVYAMFTGSVVWHYPRRLFSFLTLALACVEEGRFRQRLISGWVSYKQIKIFISCAIQHVPLLDQVPCSITVTELVQADSAGANNNKICECTFLNPGSWDAALLAAGTTLSAMKHILDGHAKIAYALVRPPGHHAQPDRADGYCFLNNAGLAVKLALDSGRRRVAVVDIDVHYGNGTAEGFYHTDSVLTISLHMKHGSWGPSHPQSGLVDETGKGRGLGYNLNIPLPNGSGDAGYEYAMNELVFDPNGRQCLTMDGYRKIGQIMRGMADQHSNGQILIVQEGGYHITYSAYCLHATLEGVLNLQAPLLDDPLGFYPDDEKYTMQAVDIIKKCWKESIPWSSESSKHKTRYTGSLNYTKPVTREYIEELVQANAVGAKKLCEGTFLNPGSWGAALLAAGTTLSAMKHILDGHAKIAYALVRPPGHHAQPDRADGYCFLNNAGLAVKLALDSGRRKVAVVDIDVHYGNGTAEGFYHTDSVLTISLHMKHGSWGPSHPQSGSVDEIGEGRGLGYNLNIPLPNGSGDAGYEYAMNELVVPAIEKFHPELLVFVVGQDSSTFDPNGRQCLTMDGYRKIGQIMRGMADQHSNGQILIVQEGGYHISYSAYCLHATLEGVLNLQAPLLDDPIAYYPEDEKYTMKVVDIMKKCWKESIPFLKDI
uniref:Histone deacetylase n=1 Tax=Oryza barthii TaxID=65489 RepID=A0A0D3G866_9ORYZ